MGLTRKQRRYCEARADGMTPADAVQVAGYKARGGATASEMEGKPAIKAEIAVLMSVKAKRDERLTTIKGKGETKESLLLSVYELEQAIKNSGVSTAQGQVLLRAIETRAKVSGVVDNKPAVAVGIGINNAPINPELAGMSDDELRTHIGSMEEQMREAGFVGVEEMNCRIRDEVQKAIACLKGEQPKLATEQPQPWRNPHPQGILIPPPRDGDPRPSQYVPPPVITTAPQRDGKPRMLEGDWTDPVIAAEKRMPSDYDVDVRQNRRRHQELERWKVTP